MNGSRVRVDFRIDSSPNLTMRMPDMEVGVRGVGISGECAAVVAAQATSDGGHQGCSQRRSAGCRK